MKHFLNKYVMVLMLSIITFSCSDDFLEPERNTQSLTDEDFSNNININPALVEGSLNGIYTFMIQPNGALNANRHYDFGQKGVDIWTDMLSGSMALSTNTYGWYSGTSNLLFTNDFTRQENRIVWDYYFRVISTANLVITSAGGENAQPTSPAAKAILGQAKALRAYAYFYLTQLYQKSYNPSQEILPYYTTDLSLNSFAKVPASKIYDLIISDLNSSILLLDGFSRTFKHQINKDVAKGLLAYTYAAIGNYANAKTLSEEIIASSFTLMPSTNLAFPGAGSGFNNVTNPSWMWGYDLTPEIAIGLISWWGQMDIFSYSYAAAGDRKAIDNALYAQIPTNDIRRTQFFSTATSVNYLMPTNKFFAPARTVSGQNPMVTDYIFMRIEEFYLLSAESAAKTGDEGLAKQRLKQLLTIRLGNSTANADAYVNPLTGSSLINNIYLQTRIEMWGEGKSYLAMKRNQATMVRGTNHAFQPSISLPYNDDKLTFKIPQSEINNNPAITTQN